MISGKKLKIGQGLAIAALALILIYVFGEGVVPRQETRAFVFATSGIMLSVAAFAVAPRQKSILLSALLVVNGMILTIDGIMVTRNLTVVYFPGPATGLIFAAIVLAIGIAKSVITARASNSLK
ncbi:MAG TPA: hypothetical protein VF172_08920 [Nitrososphaera sp.]|jgi:hypothetical membrane protein